MSATDPADEPAAETARAEALLAEAVLAESGALMRLAAERSLIVRLTGSLAIRAVCPDVEEVTR